MILRMFIAALVSLALVATALLGGVQALGAHPWWDLKVSLIGAGLGSAVAVALGRPGGMWLAWAGLMLMVVAFLTARYGMTEFAASYAEDRFAGQLWFFGWIATCSAAVTALAGAGIALGGAR